MSRDASDHPGRSSRFFTAFCVRARPLFPVLFRAMILFGLAATITEAACAPPPASAAAPAKSVFFQSRPFQGLVRRDVAERIARVAAENDALQQAMRLLAKEPDLHFAGTPQSPSSLPPLEGLALKLYSTQITLVGVQGFPPDMQAVIEVELVPPDKPRHALLDALAKPDALDMYALIMRQRISLIPRCDTLAARLLPMNPHTAGGEDELALRHLLQHLDALDIMLSLLPGYDAKWPEPGKTYRTLLKAASMAPEEPVINTAIAETLMQLDRPAEALRYAGKAVAASPDYARAHDIQGIAYLRQRLPSLAAKSFTRAVELAPHNVRFLIHRASAYLVLEEGENMCADFRAACARGDCEGYRWARETGKCLRETAPPRGEAGL